MAINFTCQHCGAPQSSEERYAGMTGPCTACGQMVTVPHLASSVGSKEGMTTGTKVAVGTSIGTVVLVIGIVALVGLLGCGGILAALLLPAISSARLAAARTKSMNNEKQILLALHNYHDVHGELPPAYIADKNGKPMHSWRVLILPYIEQSHLHAQYDFSQPWDSPQNQIVAQNMPEAFRSPLEDQKAPRTNNTSYMFFVGPGTLFDGEGKKTFTSVPDGLSNTVILAEVNNSGVPWTQPTDLDAAQLDFLIHTKDNHAPGQINSNMPNGVTVGMLDGSVRVLSNHLDPGSLRSAVNPSDGQVTNLD